jgi:cell division protein FtsB
MITIDHVKIALFRALRQVIGPAFGIGILGYFAYHAIQGERGFIALTHLQNQIQQAEANLAQVRSEREQLEQRAQLLRLDHLDPDMLDERARAVLNYAHPDDVVMPWSRGSVAPAPAAAKPGAVSR